MRTNGRMHSERWGVQLRKGTLDLAILAALWNEKLYGLEILKRIEKAARLEIGEGTLYPILLRLKQEGLLASTWVEAEVGHPRKYYWLTEIGNQRVLDMVDIWDKFSASISGLLVPMRKSQNENNSPDSEPTAVSSATGRRKIGRRAV